MFFKQSLEPGKQQQTKAQTRFVWHLKVSFFSERRYQRARKQNISGISASGRSYSTASRSQEDCEEYGNNTISLGDVQSWEQNE